jgi:phosphate transport system protein
MGITSEQFDRRLATIRSRLAQQGALVCEIAEQAFQTIFSMDSDTALRIMTRDDEVDQADLEIERDAVDLLQRASEDGCALTPQQIRALLSAVKVNNELERIADAAADVANRVVSLGDRTSTFPMTTMVMTNSVVGILRDAVKCFSESDSERAKVVLNSEGTVLEFYDVIVKKSEQRIADGRLGVDDAFDLHSIIHQAVVMADHCTNIAEQVIYQVTGAIVRHTDAGWVECGKEDSAE